MRKNVIDRLIDTHYGLKLESKTFNLCVNILDQFISKSNFEATTNEKFEFRYLTFFFFEEVKLTPLNWQQRDSNLRP